VVELCPFSQQGMDLPFRLEEPGSITHFRAKRTQDIIDEVKQYYTKLATFWQAKEWRKTGLVPPKKQDELPEEPDVPDVLLWLSRVNAYGLPNPGTFMDQPVDFMEDMEAARLGEAAGQDILNEYKDAGISAEEINRRIEAAFSDAPTGQALVS